MFNLTKQHCIAFILFSFLVGCGGASIPVIGDTPEPTPTPEEPTPEPIINPSNLAENQTATQSSTGFGGPADRAVDGNTDGNHVPDLGSVTHTNQSTEPWWQVELASRSAITEIEIWNRTNCCTVRLSDFVVFISETNMTSRSLDELLADNSVWRYNHTGTADEMTSIPVDTNGQFVRVQLPGNERILSLAEVIVMGTLADSIEPEPTPEPVLDSEISESALRGQAIYNDEQQACAECHGDDGLSTTFKAINLGADAFEHSSNVGTLISAVEYIERFMPFSDPSLCVAECAEDVVAYMDYLADNQPEQLTNACSVNEAQVGDAVFRRLNGIEYDNTVRALLGITGDFTGTVRAVDRAGFISSGSTISDSTELSTYTVTAQELAEMSIDSAPDLSGVDMDDEGEIRNFINQFGLKAFRRPLTIEETNEYFDLYSIGRDSNTADAGRTGVEWIISAMLASPKFLYHIEKGEPNLEANGLRALTQYERANRLSYFLTGSLPDDELFQAAADGQLHSIENIREQARRLVNTDSGSDTVAEFVAQWLDISVTNPVLTERLKTFDPSQESIGDDLGESVIRTVKHWLNQNGTVGTLFTASDYVVNRSLAQSWGLSTVPSDDDTWQAVTVEERRSGILTHPAVMAIHSSEEFASATLRGAMVYSDILCRPELNPPDDQEALFPDISEPLATSRQTLSDLHAEDVVCASCHNVLDPLGFAFENFAPNGTFRTDETHAPHPATIVDASGTSIVDGNSFSYDDARGYMQEIAESKETQQCFNRQVFRFALQRSDAEEDACSLQQFNESLPDSNASIEDIFVEATTIDAFLFINGEQ